MWWQILVIFSSGGFYFHREMGVRSSADNKDGGDRVGGKASGTIKGLLNASNLKGWVFSPTTFRYKNIGAGKSRVGLIRMMVFPSEREAKGIKVDAMVMIMKC